MASPLFVLGVARSGTTLISNLLLQHSAIGGIEHKKHGGIHESGFFTLVEGRYGKLDDPANFIEFANVMAASDYFRLAGADIKFLYSIYPSPYDEVFRKVMDRYAEKSNAKYWIEKTPSHTLCADSIATYYPDGRFIIIERKTDDVLASRLNKLAIAASKKGNNHDKNRRWFWILSGLMVCQLYKNTLLNLTKKYPDRTFSLTYENLTKRTEYVMRKVCEFLEIKFEPNILKSNYPPNSSFINDPENERKNAFTRKEKQFIEVFKLISSRLPEKFLHIAFKLATYKDKRTLPQWFFLLLPDASNNLTEKL